jgi:protein required for attachment to host cells
MSTQTLDEGRRKKWVLIANRGEAKIYAADWKIETLSLVRDIPHPEGRKQNHEIDADDRGSRFSSVAGRGNSSTHGGGHPSGQQKHGLDRHEEATEHEANVFARELCHILEKGRTQGEFEELILIADPHFLGRLRGFLDKITLNMVTQSDNHNWMALQDREIQQRLRQMVLGHAA